MNDLFSEVDKIAVQYRPRIAFANAEAGDIAITIFDEGGSIWRCNHARTETQWAANIYNTLEGPQQYDVELLVCTSCDAVYDTDTKEWGFE